MSGNSMTDAINRQINAEMYSAYLYLSMSSYASHTGLQGTANWFRCQAQEEMVHAQKLYDYVNSRGNHVELAAIDGPPTDFQSLRQMFEDTLAHEKKVTAMIHSLVDQAAEEKDHATEIFLQWFVTEQVEEEETAQAVLDRLKLAGDSGSGLFMVDNELAARVFTPPVAKPQ